MTRLSKSTFIRGLQCEKSLYLHKHHYELKDPTHVSQQTVFDQGTNVGVLAQQLFPDGVDASSENHFKIVESVDKTLDFINQGKTIPHYTKTTLIKKSTLFKQGGFSS